MRKILAGERIDHYETERVRKDGTRISVSLTASPIHDASGEVVGVSTQARDMSTTQARAAEREQQLHGRTRRDRRVQRRAGLVRAAFDGQPGDDPAARIHALPRWPSCRPGRSTHPDDAERERILFEELAAGTAQLVRRSRSATATRTATGSGSG